MSTSTSAFPVLVSIERRAGVVDEPLNTFSCDGLPLLDESCSPCALVSSGALNRLLSTADVCNDDRFHGNSVQLCGHKFITCRAFTADTRATFKLIRQSLNDLDQCVESGGSVDQLRVLSQQCVSFLVFLECYVYRFLANDSGVSNRQQVAMEIASQLSVLCQHLGRLEDHLSMLRNGSPILHIHHTMLHIHWTSLCVLYRLSPVLGPSRFVQCASSVMSSCLSECALTFDLLPIPFLPCPCVGDIWTLLCQTLETKPSLTKGFWELLSDLLQPLLHPPTEHAQNLGTSEPAQNEFAETRPSTRHPVVFSWWVLCKLAALSRPTSSDSTLSMPSNWSFVLEHLLPLTFSGQLSEFKVRVCLECAVRLVEVWGVCSQLIHKAWEYCHKHMNDPLSSAVGGVLEWTPSRDSSTPRQWLDHLLQICDHNAKNKPSEWSAFELFLCLLTSTLGSHGDGQSLWKQFKGRVYSKVHRRWVCELSACGVGRVGSLYLLLAALTDHNEVSDKMVSAFLSITREGPLIWKGLLALVLLHLHLNHSVGVLIEKLTPALSNLISRFQSCDSVWATIVVILEGTVEALEMPNAIDLLAYNLIGPHLFGLLSQVEGPRLSKLLQVIEAIGSILSTHTSPPPSCCRGYLEHCILALPSHTPTPPHTLHSTAAAGALLAVQWTGQGSYAHQLFTEFAVSEVTHPFVASGFLCHVTSNPLMCRELVSTERAQLDVVHTWLRCFILSHVHPLSCDSHVTELTRLIPSLPLVSSLLNGQDSPSESLTLLRLILLALRERYVCEGVSGVWREWAVVILGDFMKMVQPCLNSGAKALKRCYEVAAVVVSSCPELIYSRINSKCLLPQLVDMLVLPMATSKASPIDVLRSCIRTHLHHFVDGLLQLSPEQDDFVKRKIRQIFSRYFLSYSQEPHPLTTPTSNPFKSLLAPWCVDPVSDDRKKQLSFLLDTITSLFLQLPRQPASLLPVLVYVREFVEGVKCGAVLVIATHHLLPHLLPCLLACDVCPPHTEPRGIRKQVMVTLRLILRSCDSSHTPQIVRLIERFVCDNLSQRGGGGVVKTLGAVLPLHPPLITPALSCVGAAVERVDDQTLRNSYQQLQTKLANQ